MAMKICIKIMLFFFITRILHCNGVQGRISTAIKEDLDLEEQLKMLNKEPIKSIQDVKGDIFDCIDIYKQPALDHPLLKNHKIQMKPTFSLEDKFKALESNGLRIALDRINCPEGTVPIRSTQKKILLKANSAKIRPFGDGEPHPGQSRAQLDFIAKASNKYFGAEGFMSLDNPQVGPEQSSWSFVSVEGGDKVIGNYSILQGGWGVSPKLFGDSKTHFIAYWSSYSDGQDAGGCYNDDCRGFVHTNKGFPLNFATTHISKYEGDRFDEQVTIRQENGSKNWELTFHNLTLGYWSNDVVPHLTNGADRISFGGVTTKSPDGISPPMGFGKFPDDSLKHSGYFVQLRAITKEGNRINPSQPAITVDHPDCYNVFPRKRPDNDEYGFTYGGPGGDCFA